MKSITILLVLLSFSLKGFSNENFGLESELNKWLTIPAQIKADMSNEIIAISIKVNEFGQLRVTGINSSNPELARYVSNLIESQQLEISDPRIGREYYYRLRFERK